MKSAIFFKLTGVLFFSLLVASLPAQVKIGDNPDLIDPSAVLELEKTDMGLLIPRISLENAVDVTDIPEPANSLLVYNVNISASDDNDAVSPGFYCWDGGQDRWVRIYSGGGYAYVVAIGWKAAWANGGIRVNAFGPFAANENGGNDVNAFGRDAAFLNEGDEVNALGAYAARDNKEWAVNAFGGAAAMRNNGYIVNAIGPQSCDSNWGNSVNGLGHLAAQRNLGSEVNAMGAMSAQFNSTANVNAFGLEACKYNSGYGTNAFGYWAAKFNNGNHAVAIGDQALLGEEGISEGEGNIGIGYHAGINAGTGQRNICIGFDTGIPVNTANDQINIGGSIIRNEFGVIRLKDLIQLTPISDPPDPAAPGMIYFDAEDAMLYCSDGSDWKALWEP